jgi:hypothetical protein
MAALNMPTPDVSTRRAMLLDAAEHAELRDALDIDDTLERFATAAIGRDLAFALFTELAAKASEYLDLANWRGSDFVTSEGLTKPEALDAADDRITQILAELAPSPAAYVGTEPTHSLANEPVSAERDAALAAAADTNVQVPA